MANLSPDSIRAAYLARHDCERCANAYRCDGVNPCEFVAKPIEYHHGETRSAEVIADAEDECEDHQ